MSRKKSKSTSKTDLSASVLEELSVGRDPYEFLQAPSSLPCSTAGKFSSVRVLQHHGPYNVFYTACLRCHYALYDTLPYLLRVSDHVKSSNCSSNPWCAFGLGELKEVRTLAIDMKYKKCVLNQCFLAHTVLLLVPSPFVICAGYLGLESAPSCEEAAPGM